MVSIYDLSWNKDSFISKICLFFKSNLNARKRINLGNKLGNYRDKAAAYSALSSIYYSIAGTAYAKFRAIFEVNSLWLFCVKFPTFIFTWAPLGLWCNYRMLHLSNKFALLIDAEDATSGECDIRQSILRRKGKYIQAKIWILLGLNKKDIETHTGALLYIGLADIYKNSGDWRKTEEYVGKALEIVAQVEEINPNQAVRIYKHCANLTDWFEEGDPLPGKNLRKKAENLARRIGAKDQIVKIKN